MTTEINSINELLGKAPNEIASLIGAKKPKPNTHLDMFIEYVTSQSPIKEIKRLFSDTIYHQDDLAFYYIFAITIFNVSCNRLATEGHVGLIEDAARQFVQESLSGFVEHISQSYKIRMWMDDLTEALIKSLATPNTELKFMVEHILFEDTRSLFPEVALTTPIDDAAQDEQHPMRTFARYIDNLEYLRKVGSSACRNEVVRHRHVVTLRRVGLAVLPPETWVSRITLLSAPA